MSEFIQGTLTFANLLLSIFVLFYAASFLRKTKDTTYRKPWKSLFLASILFFILEFLKTLDFLNVISLGDFVFYIDSLFIAALLFAFLFQHKLLVERGFILIHSRKNEVSIIKRKETLTQSNRLIIIKKKK